MVYQRNNHFSLRNMGMMLLFAGDGEKDPDEINHRGIEGLSHYIVLLHQF